MNAKCARLVTNINIKHNKGPYMDDVFNKIKAAANLGEDEVVLQKNALTEKDIFFLHSLAYAVTVIEQRCLITW